MLCYSPCIDWGIDMSKMMAVQKLAVDSGYWPLYRYDPSLKESGDNPFRLDSRRIKTSLANYLKGENRYAALRRADSSRADLLQGAFEDYTHRRMDSMQRRAMDDSELLDLLKARIGEQTSEKARCARCTRPSMWIIAHPPTTPSTCRCSCSTRRRRAPRPSWASNWRTSSSGATSASR